MTDNCITYTGDLLVTINENGNWDLLYDKGQPCMTDGLDSAVALSIFADPDTWQNGLTNNPSEKFISEFPDVVKRATVSDKTLKDGIQALKKALKWITDDKAAESIEVTGEAFSIYGITWTVEIIKGGIVSKYTINWEKGITSLIKEQTE